MSILRKCIRMFRRAAYRVLGTPPSNQGYNPELISEQLRYLYYEVSILRSAMRHLTADSEMFQIIKNQTKKSFDHQWGNLPEGQWMLSNPEFRKNVHDRILNYTCLPDDWFKGKSVLDAGCGSGRYTYGLAKLGAEVTALDQSLNGLNENRSWLEKDGLINQVTLVQDNLLDLQSIKNKFDLVWSYGVLHHTGNTYGAFKNIASLVKPGGYLFLMLYGEPRIDAANEFYAYSEYNRLRFKTRTMPPEAIIEVLKAEKPLEDLHGWFDAVSPQINDSYQFEEIEEWLISEGYDEITRTDPMINHHIIARKK